MIWLIIWTVSRFKLWISFQKLKLNKLVTLAGCIFFLGMFKIWGDSCVKLLNAFFFKETLKKFSEVETLCPLTVGFTFGNRQKWSGTQSSERCRWSGWVIPVSPVSEFQMQFLPETRSPCPACTRSAPYICFFLLLYLQPLFSITFQIFTDLLPILRWALSKSAIFLLFLNIPFLSY